MLSKDQAIKIATERAVADPYGMFEDPFLDSVVRQESTGHWVVKLLSLNPNSGSKGAMYMYIVVDKTTGVILSVDSGGGS